MIESLTTTAKTFRLVFAAGFFGFPTWYEYLPKNTDGSPKLDRLMDFWLIIAAVLEMIIRLGGMLAVGYFIYSGIKFMTSQGNPEKIAQARTGMIQATVGLIITLVAANVVSLVAGMF